jgi:hypothetical protein
MQHKSYSTRAEPMPEQKPCHGGMSYLPADGCQTHEGV